MTSRAAFGLSIRDGVGLRCLSPVPWPTDRAVVLEPGPADTSGGGFERAVDVRGPSGRSELSVDVHERRGYLVSAGGFGAHLVSPDGKRVTCAPPPGASRAWESLLTSQVLPLTALLQGLEVLHASAVAVDGRAVAFSGPSGAGKTTLAYALSSRGAGFVTDDVLAVEPAGDGLLAHPGPALAGVRGQAPVELPPAHGPLPLEALYLLRPGRHAPALRRLPAPAPPLLLASSFNFLVRTPTRLTAQLEVCARLARSVETFELTVPTGGDPDAVARLLWRELARGTPEAA